MTPAAAPVEPPEPAAAPTDAEAPRASSLGRLFRNASLYGLGSFLVSIIGLAVDPLLSHKLTRAEFGLLGLCASISGMLAASYTAGMDSAANRLYFDVEADPAARRRTVGTLNAFLLGWLTLLTVGQEVFGPALYAHLFDDLPYDPYGRLVAIALLLGGLGAIPRALWAAREDVQRLVGLRVVSSLLAALALVALLLYTTLGPTGVLLSEIVAPALLMVAYLRFGWGQFGFAWDPKVLGAALAFGLPMVVHLTSHWVLNAADRLVLEAYLGREAVGLYSAAYKAAVALITVNMALNGAYVPQFMRAHGKPAEVDFVARAVTAILSVSAAATLAFVALGPSLFRLLYAEQFAGAAPLVPIVCLAGLCQALYLVGVNGLFYARRSLSIPVWTVLAGLGNVGLCVWWIPRFGVVGAAWATVGGYLLLALLVTAAGRRATNIPYETGRLLRLGALVAGLLVAAFAVDGRWSLAVEIPLKLLIVLALPLLVLATGWLRPDERAWLLGRLRGLLPS